MRKIFKSFMLVAAAAMAFASCQKEEKVAPETISATLTMHADIEATKTYLGEANTVFWGTDEAVTLYVGSGETAKFFDSASTDANDGEASASFTFAMEGVTEADSYALGGIYPASAAMDDNKNATQYKVILPATQNQVDGNYDPSAYIMVLKPEIVDVLPTEYTASFRRATALNKVTLTNVAEDITSVEITVPAEKYLAGRRYFDLTTGDSGEVYYDKSSTISVNSAFTGNSIDVWFCSWGVELAAGEKLTITMKSATKSYTRTITANENGIRFVEGDLNTLKINMASATVEDTGDFSGEWLITGVKDEQVYAASAYVSGNNLKSVAISIEDGQILEVDGIANCMMTLTKIADGDYAGMYTITDVNGKYLYAANSSGNQLKGATEVSVNAYWTVELLENGTYSIVASKSSNRNVMQFNGSDATNVLFNCYSTASQSPVTLYPYSMVKADTTPRIIVAEEALTQNVDADATELSFNYSLKNISGVPTATVAADATMTNVSATADNGTVTVTFAANEEESPKTATVTLSYDGADPVSVIITQAAKAAEGGESGWISTPFANLKEGDQVVIVSTKNTDTWAMSNDKGTGAAPAGVTGVTYANGKLTVEPAANIIWYVGVDGNNRIFYNDSGKDTWLYCTGTNNGVRVGTNTAKAFTFESNYLKHVGTGRYVGVYTTNPDWRCYTSINTNIQGQTFQFFVKAGEGSGETPVEKTLESIAVSDAKTEYTVGDEFVKPTVTATYSDDSTEDVTASAEFTGYNMSAADTYTVTVSYSGKTTTYSITVSAAQGEGGGDSQVLTKNISFSAYAAGTQYAQGETHDLGDGFTLTINGGHLNTQVRLYDGSNATVQSPGVIQKLDVTAGNKAATLTVYGSTNGEAWTEVQKISTTTSYTKYSVDMSSGNYTWVKFASSGAQIRLSLLDVTYQN